MPDTKPDLSFDDAGVCNACRNFERRRVVDWERRRLDLVELINRYRNPSGSNWDCVVPVSGGNVPK